MLVILFELQSSHLNVLSVCITIIHIYTFIGEDDIATFCICRNSACNCCKTITIQHRLFASHKRRQFFLQFKMNIDCSIEASRSTRADTILIYRLLCYLLDQYEYILFSAQTQFKRLMKYNTILNYLVRCSSTYLS